MFDYKLNVFSFRASENCLPKPHISIVREKIETAIFGNRYDEVLIATENGSIKVNIIYIDLKLS